MVGMATETKILTTRVQSMTVARLERLTIRTKRPPDEILRVALLEHLDHEERRLGIRHPLLAPAFPQEITHGK